MNGAPNAFQFGGGERRICFGSLAHCSKNSRDATLVYRNKFRCDSLELYRPNTPCAKSAQQLKRRPENMHQGISEQVNVLKGTGSVKVRPSQAAEKLNQGGKTQSGGRRGFQPPHKASRIDAGFSPGGTCRRKDEWMVTAGWPVIFSEPGSALSARGASS